jgi:hypothetical protein
MTNEIAEGHSLDDPWSLVFVDDVETILNQDDVASTRPKDPDPWGVDLCDAHVVGPDICECRNQTGSSIGNSHAPPQNTRQSRSRSRSRSSSDAAPDRIDRKGRAVFREALQPPQFQRGIAWWAAILWNALEHVFVIMPEKPHRPMLVESLMAGMATEAFGFKVAPSGFVCCGVRVHATNECVIVAGLDLVRVCTMFIWFFLVVSS